MAACALVVDDDRLFLRLVELNLGKIGLRVVLAEDGPEALRLAFSESPDVILLDLMMPRMDGYEVMRQLKASEKTRGIPVIMLTAKSGSEDRDRCAELGAAGYITKPFRLEDLRSTVRTIVEAHRDSTGTSQ
jgi:CheY-like chemotaxis protein